MPSITRRRSRLCLHVEYIDSQNCPSLGLGVIIAEDPPGYGLRVEEPPLREIDALLAKSTGQQKTMPYQTPRLRQQQVLTKTMLDTYALMRGRLGRGELGPLYSKGFVYRPWQPKAEDEDPKLSPIIPWRTFDHEDKETKTQKYVSTPDLEGIFMPRETAFSERLNQIGYLMINGKVTDPDSKEEVLNALDGIRGCSPPLPGFRVPLPSYIMSSTELKEYYIQFILDVDNEEDVDRDNEGNPLDNHISPGTFLEWAAGAQKIDNLDTAEIEIEAIRRARHEDSKGKKTPGSRRSLEWSALTPQYDEESGSTYSPVYSVDENPSPLMSPQGVNMSKVPHMFYHMLPEFNKQLARAVFYDGGIDLSPKVSSETEIITDGYLAEVLGDGNRELGMHRIDIATQGFEALKAERDAEVERAAEMFLQVETAMETVNQLQAMALARRHEILIPKRRARVRQLLGEWEESLRHEIARSANMTKIYTAQMQRMRETTARLVGELQDLEEHTSANNGS